MKQRRGGTSEKEEENECVKERERQKDRTNGAQQWGKKRENYDERV